MRQETGPPFVDCESALQAGSYPANAKQYIEARKMAHGKIMNISFCKHHLIDTKLTMSIGYLSLVVSSYE